MSAYLHRRLQWRIPDGVVGFLIFGLLLACPLINGYPFVFPDSGGYDCICPDELRSPVLGCAMRPITWAGGAWAFVVVQCAVTAFAIVLFWSRELNRRHTVAGSVSLVVCGLGLFAGWIMADVWTLVGLLALFMMICGNFHPAAAGLLAFACATHLGNFPVFAVTALAMLPFVEARLKVAAGVGLCLLAAVGLILGSNLIGGQARVGSKNGYVFLASRILHDIPEVIERKCEEDPAFPLCARKEEVLQWSAENHQSFTWMGFYRLGLAWEEYNRQCREIVLYSVRRLPRFFCEQAAAAVRNTWELLVFPKLSNGFEPFDANTIAVEDIRICFPAEVDDYLMSRQASGALERFLKRLDTPFIACIWLSTLSCLAAVVAFWRGRRDDILIRLALFALIAVLTNAFFMSNLSGVFGRYQARIAFLVIFPGFALIPRWFRKQNPS